MGLARIGKIRLKNGGAEVRLLRQELSDCDGSENWRGRLIEHARVIAERDAPGKSLVGFCIIGLFSDGSYSHGIRWDDDRSPIPRTLMPAYVEEILRRDLLTEPAAERIASKLFNGGE